VTSWSATTFGSRLAKAVTCSTIRDPRRATFHVINRMHSARATSNAKDVVAYERSHKNRGGVLNSAQRQTAGA
jgi:hypothetical protein